MKLIIPMAGGAEGRTMHPSSQPKSFLHMAGKPLLGHLLDSISSVKIEETIFIVDRDDEHIREYISKNYNFKTRYILQKERKGVGHAIYGAKKHVKNDELLVLFADTLIDANLKVISKNKAEGIIWTKQVRDPRKYGVVFLHNNTISRLIEKPETPVSDLAMVGLYYFKKPDALFNSLAHIIKNDIKTKGAYQLTDAIQLMINKGAKFSTEPVSKWKDCEDLKSLLEANKYLLEKNKAKMATPKNTVIIKPVFIGKGARVSNSVIGPNVSIGKNAEIEGSIIRESIINDEATITDANLKECVVGKKSRVIGVAKKLNTGDYSEIEYS